MVRKNMHFVKAQCEYPTLDCKNMIVIASEKILLI